MTVGDDRMEGSWFYAIDENMHTLSSELCQVLGGAWTVDAGVVGCSGGPVRQHDITSSLRWADDFWLVMMPSRGLWDEAWERFVLGRNDVPHDDGG